MFQINPFHLVSKSPWPMVSCLAAFGLTMGGVMFFHFGYSFLLIFAFVTLSFISYLWWSDVISENQLGFHTAKVSSKLRFGVILFILSEVLFFFGFFWSYFHVCWGPTSQMGFLFPPTGFKKIMVDPLSIPLLNTVVLISSGVSITWCHHEILQSKFRDSVISLFFTIFLGAYFLFLQGGEYMKSNFSVKSTVYGTVFFMLTGFHGFHVTIGVTLLMVCFIRLCSNHFKSLVHVGFEASAWYWHFVDVVWIFLFLFVYCYGF